MFVIKIYHKLFIVLCIILSIVLLFFNNISSAFSIQYNDDVYDFGDVPLFDYVYIQKKVDNEGNVTSFSLYTYEQEPYFYKHDGDIIHLMGVGNRYAHNFNVSTGKVTVGSLSNLSSPNRLILIEDFKERCIYSNFDIKDTEGNVLFQRPVMSLAASLVTAEPVKTFQTMMSGMIVFLVVCLVGLVAFWKAWQFLSKELRKA